MCVTISTNLIHNISFVDRYIKCFLIIFKTYFLSLYLIPIPFLTPPNVCVYSFLSIKLYSDSVLINQ